MEVRFSLPLYHGKTMTLQSQSTMNSQNLTSLEESGCLEQYAQNALFSACLHSNLLHCGMAFTRRMLCLLAYTLVIFNSS